MDFFSGLSEKIQGLSMKNVFLEPCSIHLSCQTTARDLDICTSSCSKISKAKK